MNPLPYKTALVTGASGFIGEHLCHQLIKQGVEVYGVSRKHKETDEDNIHWKQVNLAIAKEVQQLISEVQPDVIFHLAGEVTGSRNLTVILPTFENIAASTINILLAATEQKIQRVILAGSMEEQEKNEEYKIPSAPYTAAKRTASLYAQMFHALYQTPVVLLRLFMVYGPSQKDMTKFIPYTITSILQNKPLAFSSGTRDVDWIYVDDVVRALVLSADVPGIEGKTIDIGSGALYTIKQVAEKIADKMGYKKNLGFGLLPDRPLERITVADTKMAYKLMGWQPEISIDSGLEKTIVWYTQDHS